MKTYGGSGGTAPHTHNLGTGWWWVVNFTSPGIEAGLRWMKCDEPDIKESVWQVLVVLDHVGGGGLSYSWLPLSVLLAGLFMRMTSTPCETSVRLVAPQSQSVICRQVLTVLLFERSCGSEWSDIHNGRPFILRLSLWQVASTVMSQPVTRRPHWDYWENFYVRVRYEHASPVLLSPRSLTVQWSRVWKPKIYYRVRKSLLLDHILIQLNTLRTLIWRSILILFFRLCVCFPGGVFLSDFRTKMYSFLFLPYACYMSIPSPYYCFVKILIFFLHYR